LIGLLPSDALILATCNGIMHLISLDSDFEGVCGKEGVILMGILIDNVEKLKKNSMN